MVLLRLSIHYPVLLSMTGFGEAHCQRDALAVAVEVRSINNRFLKLSVRTSEGYGSLEPLIEGAVRQQVRRGTIQVNLRVDRTHSADDYRLNTAVLARFETQLAEYQRGRAPSEPVPLAALLALPGVVQETAIAAHDPASDWPAVAEALAAAMQSLSAMRRREGEAMARDLAGHLAVIIDALKQVDERMPLVVEEYRRRLEERVNKILAEFAIALNPADVIKEVSLMADRSDIAEEITRLRSHVEQFRGIMESEESAGRKLEFVTQEMYREVNTIGSKAGDVEIARAVIEMKAAVERIREMIQNIE